MFLCTCGDGFENLTDDAFKDTSAYKVTVILITESSRRPMIKRECNRFPVSSLICPNFQLFSALCYDIFNVFGLWVVGQNLTCSQHFLKFNS